MESSNFKAKEIQITSVYFRNNPHQLRFESYPRRLVYKGREYTLIEA